jgi:hypothetical protein
VATDILDSQGCHQTSAWGKSLLHAVNWNGVSST